MNTVIDGYNINYKITEPENAKKTAVILQGWGTGCDLYDFTAGCINDGYRVVQFDFPGFGESDEPSEPWRPADYARFFCKFMEALGIGEAVLIGHSYGGRVIIKLAARDAGSGDALPFEIDKIMLIDSAGIVPERSWQQRLKVKRFRALRKFLTSPPVHAMFPEVIDFWINSQGSADYRNASPIMKKCLVMAVNEDLRHLFPSVKQETLLVWGDADLDTPISDAHIMEEMMPDAGLAIFEGAGHYSYLEQPVLFRTVIRTYLDADEEAEGGAEA
jgi:pimeloyl-ACP methyl ester carboxylesterase